MTHPGGRPSKYNPETLRQVWDEYKQNCIEKGELANISGFALFADCHRDTIYSYFALPEFTDTKNKIEADIENTAVQQGINARNPAFLIFYMKNKCGWKDRQELDVNADVDAQISVKFVQDEDEE